MKSEFLSLQSAEKKLALIVNVDHIITGVIRFIERNGRERISNGGQVLRDDRESSGNGS